MKHTQFQFLMGDVNWLDYGGSWCRKVGNRYHVIEFTNMHDATGDTDQAKYCVELREIDLDSPQRERAAESCDVSDDASELEWVYALSSYGAYAPLDSWSGNNAHRLLREARAESRSLESDPDALEAALDRPVNRIGSTAREYQAGDINSAILRGLSEGRKDAEIMLKMMGLAIEGLK